ncbi:hypothetical protein E3P92_03933 [Wallemia ichthyophaga]|uniref:Major royal jelly protein n=2 Tax=Wallemia ichthyophaga TaxID=245174 RepID=A0A4T0HZH2_WALIC|nr:Major royal jelly protein 1 [Wallemia ichthyophaga EXF-994]TIA68682.1 hypothetical protein E3P91_03976 [Wallemia ichthyophaga]EOR03743.1 Major royal jelly protein 1 [Wallemia ichthyophaga EXF-994]TIA78230.1 hypothetical protein E3P98_03923 [Wallemia ichthyophaga]TIB07256.1 hypothetical protein E3P93_03925 [Wallemia ichthyophaga]TIB07740.1 hypothetical protein E3P90_03928 [Wallemia ichthyophaga]
MKTFSFAFLGALATAASASSDLLLEKVGKPDFGGQFGPSLKVEHLFYDLFPAGVAVTQSGRMFSTFPRGPGNNYTLAELVNIGMDEAFPSLEANTLPALQNASNPGYSASYDDLLVSCQGIVVDAMDRLWVLDTGRASGAQLQPWGSKLLAYDTGKDASTEPVEKIILSPDVAFPSTYLNDLRIDLSKNDKGVVYITDSSDEGRTGMIVVDIATGEAWRHLDIHPSTRPDTDAIFSFKGQSVYATSDTNKGFWTTGIDGIALSADGEWIYYTPMTSRKVYRVPSEKLRTKPSTLNTNAKHAADAAVEFLGQKGSCNDGMETDSNGLIYFGAPEQDGIQTYDPSTGLFGDLIHNHHITWPDTLSIADHKLYWIDNQFYLQDRFWNGTDRTVKPYTLYSIDINATSVHM